MKKLLTLLMLAGVFTFSATAQDFTDSSDGDSTATDSAAVDTTAQLKKHMKNQCRNVEEVLTPVEEAAVASKGFHQVVKEQFIDGGPTFMGIV